MIVWMEQGCLRCTGHDLNATELTFRYNDDLSLEDAIHTALLTLKEGFEGQMTEHTIPPTFRKLSEQEVRDYLAL
jgi:20S proteasome subunit alpha 2